MRTLLFFSPLCVVSKRKQTVAMRENDRVQYNRVLMYFHEVRHNLGPRLGTAQKIVSTEGVRETCLSSSDRENQLCIYLPIERMLKTRVHLCVSLHTVNRISFTEQHVSHNDRRARSSFPSAFIDVNQSFRVSEHELSPVRSELCPRQPFADQFIEHVPLSMLQHQYLRHSHVHRRQSDLHTILRAVESRHSAIAAEQLGCRSVLVRKPKLER